MVISLVTETFSMTPLMVIVVPAGNGVAVGAGDGTGEAVRVAVWAGGWAGVAVLFAACTSMMMLRARFAPSAVRSPRMWAIAPNAGRPVIVVAALRTIGVLATTQRSWASSSMWP